MVAPRVEGPQEASAARLTIGAEPPRRPASLPLPAPSRLRAAGLILLAWSGFGVLLGEQAYVLEAEHGPTSIWSHAIAFGMNYCLIWALLTFGVLRVGRVFPLVGAARERRLGRALAAHLAAAAACALIVPVAQAETLPRLYRGWFAFHSRADLARSLMGSVDYCFILYCVVTLLGQSFQHWRSLNEARVRQAQLLEQLAAAQLQALQMQMHPHFLFNALNSVAELIHEDAPAAERMLTRLGELLRIYLRSSETQEISLLQEVDFLRRYLEIQKLRFDDRLAVQITLPRDTEAAMVPSLILQPLVENAIVHGIADREHDGLVTITAARAGGALVLRVADNGPGPGARSGAPIVEGRGLRHTRVRLEQLYGPRQQMAIEPLAGGGLCASIRIPLERRAAGVA